MSAAFKQKTIRINLNGGEPLFGALSLTGLDIKQLPFVLFLMAIQNSLPAVG